MVLEALQCGLKFCYQLLALIYKALFSGLYRVAARTISYSCHIKFLSKAEMAWHPATNQALPEPPS